MDIFLQIFILLLVIIQNISIMNLLKIFFLEKENNSFKFDSEIKKGF